MFIDAGEDALLRRYSETRRPHPFGKHLSVRESLGHERQLMEPIRKLADVVIDTSKFNVHELRHFVTERFKNPEKRPMLVSFVSFGYRYGVPTDADLVFDVRRIRAVVAPESPRGGEERGSLHVLRKARRPTPVQHALFRRRIDCSREDEHTYKLYPRDYWLVD